ncbi:MAG: protein-disulfide reductase DsbD domain-containing protein [Pseudomonadota bacterium]
MHLSDMLHRLSVSTHIVGQLFRGVLPSGVTAFLGGIAPATALAAGNAILTDTVETDHTVTHLEAVADGIAPGQSVDLVLRQELEEGWHVYWRNPGDSGLPLETRWSVPDGFEVSDTEYPAPERIQIGPFVNYGHHGEPSFVASVTAPTDAAPGDIIPLELDATWLICEETCVPEDASFSLALPISETPTTNTRVALAAAVTRDQAAEPWAGSADFFKTDQGPFLVFQNSADVDAPDGQEVYFFSDAEAVIEPSAPQSVFDTTDGRRALRLVGGSIYQIEDVQRLSGRLAIGGGDARVDYQVSAELTDAPFPGVVAQAASNSSAPGSASNTTSTTNFLALLAFAFVGGIILNAMPCVFPIIFVKAASLVNDAATGNATAMRRHGLIYGAGVVATFLALGGALLVLRAGGEQLGWGFHLQSPPMVAISAALLFLVGLNLAGVFEVGGSLQNVGSGLASKGGDAGAFFTGALAVFVAAPCVGPFLSAPLGAAAFLPPAAGVAIFLAIALGLAAPYVAISFSPAIAKRLPKPGGWMTIFKQALSFPVFAAAAFFVWVLAQQVAEEGLALALLGLLLFAVAAWLFGLSQKSGGSRLQLAAALTAILAVAPLTQLSVKEDVAIAAKGGYGQLTPVAFDQGAIPTARQKGGVFVDFTAAWCVTCQFNKRTILSTKDVQSLFVDNNVTLMAADWTRRDPVVTKALEAFGANGVPLYVFYPPVGDPIVLPLPLRKRDIENAVAAASPLQAVARSD